MVNAAMDTDANDAFLPLQQSAPYAAAARLSGARVIEVDLVGGRALVVERGRVRLISRGPVWVAGVGVADRRRALRRLARWPGVTVVTPEAAVAGLGLIPLVTPMHHAVWDLAGDLRAGLGAKWRNRLAGGERRGLGFDRDREGALSALIEAEAAQHRARRYQALPAGFSAGLPQDCLRLWEWRWQGQVAAAMCFVRHGATASYHMAWAGPAARGLAVHQAMLWQAALALRGEGVRWLDLGSVNTEDAPGLAAFKLGTGAGLRRLGATLLVLPG
ncbi:MAG: GNAT family N-acetyltransferase [Tabrizicola sp.]|uniref:GNAT family N-acetyltransferase n=1 Tax=Tabrizicola sp. TaxID=2005166 RepID=UPI002733CEE5|nr:GNAT family N-acetyltransferase [Tabrizicola sp.]MDP3263296.1 GNAT family N-acetyltransferase [Tabrizicola sp.]MDP3646653.1 GNAT family N-acetyltransferase [Paracoccaceae bacterium]